MDNASRRRRHNDPPQYPASNPRFSRDQGQGRSFTSSTSDRFIPPPITTSPPAPRGASGPTSGYGYYAEPTPTFPATVPAGQMQYGPEYNPDQRQQQGFASYNSSMMYNVNQQSPQSNVYDAAQQYQQRPPASVQSFPDVASPYYAGEPSSASGAPVLQTQPSSNSSTVFQQSPAERNSILQGFTGNMSGIGSIAQAQAGNEEEDYAAGSLDEAYNDYQNHLKQIFQNIRSGILVEASSSLVQVSDWLLSHVGELGLTADDESLHQDRIKLWNEFNNAWLAVLQRQKDLSLELLQTGISPRPPQSLIPYEFLKKMAKELIRLCDNIEKHGLVDYQYGVWEERIIDILIECVELLESVGGNRSVDAGSGRPNPSLGIGRPPP